MTPTLAERDSWGWRLTAAAACAALALLGTGEARAPAASARRICVQPERVSPLPVSPRRASALPPAQQWRSGPVDAVIQTRFGTITCRLDEVHAPHTVATFVALARGELPSGGGQQRPFYDGLTFHRVIPGFVIQGGDPNGDGTGGPGFERPDEIAPDLHFDGPGVLAMANRGKDTNGSQFFITDQAAPQLDLSSTIFGRCDHADVIHAIASVPRTSADRPIEPVAIEHVTIVDR